ncbi:hypothetical protein ACFC6L_29045 [Kitasatospora phosalacinea]|uniref:hypothetical protein n=1 Tax=Kitasatospora phosalacinea TaxID=2065 RepID=UPI0035E1C5E3
MPEGRYSLLRHGRRCELLPVIGAGHLPWAELVGRELRLVREFGDGTVMVVTGTVTASRGTGPMHLVLDIVRTDPGSEGRAAAVLPREWSVVEPVDGAATA